MQNIFTLMTSTVETFTVMTCEDQGRAGQVEELELFSIKIRIFCLFIYSWVMLVTNCLLWGWGGHRVPAWDCTSLSRLPASPCSSPASRGCRGAASSASADLLPINTFCSLNKAFFNTKVFPVIRPENISISQLQGGEGRISEAENLRSSSQIQSIFNLLGRTGKNIIFIIRVGIWRCNEHGKR